MNYSIGLNQNIESETIIENNHTDIKESRIIFFLIMVIMFLIFLTLNIMLSMVFGSDIPAPAWLLFSPIYLIFIFAFIFIPRNAFGLVKFSLTMTKVSISLNRKTYFELELDSIKEISIIKNTVEKVPTKYSFSNRFTSNSIQFICKNFEKEIRLWCCGFRPKKQKLIIESLTNLCEALDKSVRIIDARSIIIRMDTYPCAEIEDFLKKPKKFQLSNKYRS